MTIANTSKPYAAGDVLLSCHGVVVPLICACEDCSSLLQAGVAAAAVLLQWLPLAPDAAQQAVIQRQKRTWTAHV
jgi:hypothetical protein